MRLGINDRMAYVLTPRSPANAFEGRSNGFGASINASRTHFIERKGSANPTEAKSDPMEWPSNVMEAFDREPGLSSSPAERW
jgi:hypothetical protein